MSSPLPIPYASNAPGSAVDPAAVSAWSGVPWRRMVAVSAVAGALVAGHLFDIATQWEHWPVSPYPMYAELEPGPYRLDYRVVGVRPDGREERLDAKWLRKSFILLSRDLENPKKRQKLDDAMRQYLKSTKSAKLTATDEDVMGTNTQSDKLPTYIGVRLYKQQWNLREDLANLDKPDTNELVAEVWEKGVARPGSATEPAGTVAATMPAAAEEPTTAPTTKPAKKKPKKKPASAAAS